jgi:hypothetical protein
LLTDRLNEEEKNLGRRAKPVLLATITLSGILLFVGCKSRTAKVSAPEREKEK